MEFFSQYWFVVKFKFTQPTSNVRMTAGRTRHRRMKQTCRKSLGTQDQSEIW